MHTFQNIYFQITQPNLKLGDLRVIAKEIKKDHNLALELWNSQHFRARLLAILIMDAKEITLNAIEQWVKDVKIHSNEEQLQLIDWLLANQLSKNKTLVSLMQTWETHSNALLRRTFWYHQGRLRWVGQIPPNNTEELLLSIEKNIINEAPEVQWAMNFTTAQIGIFDECYRSRCIAIGETTGLYKDEKVAKNCTPNYLPLYIQIQVDKLSNNKRK